MGHVPLPLCPSSQRAWCPGSFPIVSPVKFRAQALFAGAVLLLANSARADPPSSETKQPTGPNPVVVSPDDVRLTSFAEGPSARVSIGMTTDNPRVTLFRLLDRFDVGGLVAGIAVVPVVVMSLQPVRECAAPCNKSVDPRFLYLVAGEGITPSSTFRFPTDHSAYKLDVNAGSSSTHTAGVVLTAAGIGLAALGGAFLLVSALERDSPTVIPTAGAVGGGVGVVAMAVGIPLWLSGRTSVQVNAAMNAPPIRLPGGMALGAQGVTF